MKDLRGEFRSCGYFRESMYRVRVFCLGFLGVGGEGGVRSL